MIDPFKEYKIIHKSLSETKEVFRIWFQTPKGVQAFKVETTGGEEATKERIIEEFNLRMSTKKSLTPSLFK